MSKDCTNIYKKARNYAGLTQLEAAERLYISTRSLIDYEAGKTVPSCDTVINMVEVYGTKWLAYKHLRISTKVGSMYLPNLDMADLPRSVLQLQKEITDVVNVRDNMIETAMSGSIEEHEKEVWGVVTKEVKEMIQAGLGLLFYRK